jgi:hypothetical protein
MKNQTAPSEFLGAKKLKIFSPLDVFSDKRTRCREFPRAMADQRASPLKR